MDLFVNELSLHGQFDSVAACVRALKEVMACRDLAGRGRHAFLCPRTLPNRQALPGVSLREVVRQTKDANLNRLVMAWIDKNGPFWDERRAHGPDDYFECAGEIVTDCGLGEAAFRLSTEQISAMVGFADSSFCLNPLRVVWRRSDRLSQDVDIPNFWQREHLDIYLRAHETMPQSWQELIEYARRQYRHLILVDSILDPLLGEPFSPTISQRVLALLSVLDQLKASFDADGRLTSAGHQLLQAYFHGDRALFSDESETNKRVFARQLTFKIPSGEHVFCPYHGKISFRYFRVHHSWPIRADLPLYVVYVGPKLTRT